MGENWEFGPTADDEGYRELNSRCIMKRKRKPKTEAQIAAETPRGPLQELALKYDNLKFYDYQQESKELTARQSETWERQEAFIDCFIVAHGHIIKACQMARISRNTYYVWLRDDANFVERLHSRKLEWESQLHAKAAVMALNGNTQMLKFLLEFLNPYYDSAFRTKALEIMQREAIADKYPIPQPTILPPKIPDRIAKLSDQPPESDSGDSKE